MSGKKNDNDEGGSDPAPKGFEKFFRKRNERKEATPEKDSSDKEKKAKEEQEESKEEEGGSDEKEKEKKKKSSSGDESFYQKMRNVYFDPSGGPKPEMWMTLVAALACSYLVVSAEKPRKEVVFMSFLNDYLLKNTIKEIRIKKDRASEVFNHKAEIDTIEGDRLYMVLGSQESFLAKLDQVQRQMGKQPGEFIPVKYVNEEDNAQQTIFKVLMAFLVGITIYQIYKGVMPGAGKAGKGKKGSGSSSSGSNWFGGGNMMGNMTKSKVAIYGEDKKIDVRFKDVAGNENAK